ncbi:MAG: hypothetical protein R3Y22_03835 [Bacteroidales bacterium]
MKPKKENLLNAILTISMITLLVTAMLPLLQIIWIGTPILFSIAAAGTFVARIFTSYGGDNFRLKRLYRMELISTLCYMVSAFFMFFPQNSTRDWLAFLTVGAVLQVYSSFMISYVEKKESSK